MNDPGCVVLASAHDDLSAQRASAGSRRCEIARDVAECADLGHRQAIIVGDINRCGTSASSATGARRVHVRNLVVLRVPLASELRLASAHFARAVASDTAASTSLFIAVVDFSERSIRHE